MTTYCIEITNEDKQAEYIQLDAKSAAGAIRKAKAWMARNEDVKGHIDLRFNRDEDGQVGYIDEMGNHSINGSNWR